MDLMKAKKILLMSGFLFASICYAQNFKTGESLFRQNKSTEAIPFLEKSIEGAENPKAYNYLGIAYMQAGDFNSAIKIFEAGLNVSGTDKKVLCYNCGNAWYSLENYKEAEKWYGLALSASPSYAEPYLNRANSRLSMGLYGDSVGDYKKYLELKPDDEQKEKILALIALLEEESERIAREEEERKAEEERIRIEEEKLAAQRAVEEARLAEERRIEEERLAAEKAEQERIEREKRALEEEQKRIEEEKRAVAEAERRRRLLEDVAASLQKTETENMNAGAEGTVDYGFETELE